MRLLFLSSFLLFFSSFLCALFWAKAVRAKKTGLFKSFFFFFSFPPFPFPLMKGSETYGEVMMWSNRCRVDHIEFWDHRFTVRPLLLFPPPFSFPLLFLPPDNSIMNHTNGASRRSVPLPPPPVFLPFFSSFFFDADSWTYLRPA